jgi:hypothetical protein
MVKPFFSIPDTELTQESSFDPMGIMPIWIHYGQRLFDDKLTTIANDVRVYSFNLFHHYVIYELFRKHSDEIIAAKQKFKGWQSDADVKAGLLIFLEDLIAHIFYIEGANKPEIDNIGILGLSKARQSHNTNDFNSLVIKASKNSGLLKNQLNLGMTGRYKGPMMNMRYFDRSFSYIPDTWEHVSSFLEKWTDAIELKNQLTKLITKYLFQAERGNAPTISLQKIKFIGLWKSIANQYLKCFGKKQLPQLLKQYWKDKLGLNAGAPEVLYSLVAALKEKEAIEHEQIFRRSLLNLKDEPKEMAKVQRILDIEPFLSYSEYAGRFLAQPKTKIISDEVVALNSLREAINDSASFTLDRDVPRLTELVNAMTVEGDLENWLSSVNQYHRKINLDRGGNSWFEIENNGILKHNFSPALNDKFNTIEKYLNKPFWFHTYYLETLRSIYLGIQ